MKYSSIQLAGLALVAAGSVACVGSDSGSGSDGDGNDCRKVAHECDADAVCLETSSGAWGCHVMLADGGFAAVGSGDGAGDGDGDNGTGGDDSGGTGGASGDGDGTGGTMQDIPPTALTPATACTALQQKVRSCGRFADTGELPPGLCSLGDPYEHDILCLVECLLEVPCDPGVIADAFHVAHCGTYDSPQRLACEQACVSDQYTCGSGQVVPRSDLCDPGACDDGSDLKDPLVGCGFSSQEFTCANGSIVDLDRRCDGDQDCDDGSDEADCAEELIPCYGGECMQGSPCPAGFECIGGGGGTAGSCVPL